MHCNVFVAASLGFEMWGAPHLWFKPVMPVSSTSVELLPLYITLAPQVWCGYVWSMSGSCLREFQAYRHQACLMNRLGDLKRNDRTNKWWQQDALNVAVRVGVVLLTGEMGQLQPRYMSLMLILYYNRFNHFTGEYRCISLKGGLWIFE